MDIRKVTHTWRGTKEETYDDVARFCRVTKLEEVREHNYILTLGRYVGPKREYVKLGRRIHYGCGEKNN